MQRPVSPGQNPQTTLPAPHAPHASHRDHPLAPWPPSVARVLADLLQHPCSSGGPCGRRPCKNSVRYIQHRPLEAPDGISVVLGLLSLLSSRHRSLFPHPSFPPILRKLCPCPEPRVLPLTGLIRSRLQENISRCGSEEKESFLRYCLFPQLKRVSRRATSTLASLVHPR